MYYNCNENMAGADINVVDKRGRSALHFAAVAQCLQSLKILLALGGNPLLKDYEGRDVFSTSFVYSDATFSKKLIELAHVTREHRIELYELLGTYLLPWRNISPTAEAFSVWRKAIKLRQCFRLPKNRLTSSSCVAAYYHVLEFQTIEELDLLQQLDIETIEVQSLLVRERILGLNWESYLQAVLLAHRYLRADHYAQHNRLLYSFHLHCLAHRLFPSCLRQQNFAVPSDSGHLSVADHLLARFLRQEFLAGSLIENPSRGYYMVVTSIDLLISDFKPENANEACEIYASAAESFNRLKNDLLCLIGISQQLAALMPHLRKDTEQRRLKTALKRLVAAERMTKCQEPFCLMHSVVQFDSLNWRTWLNMTMPSVRSFTSVIKLLFDCGLSVNARDTHYRTPLHLCSSRYSYCLLNGDGIRQEIYYSLAKTLIDCGSHWDAMDCNFRMASQGLPFVRPNKSITLACLCARVIRTFRHLYNDFLQANCPRLLRDFIDKH